MLPITLIASSWPDPAIFLTTLLGKSFWYFNLRQIVTQNYKKGLELSEPNIMLFI